MRCLTLAAVAILAGLASWLWPAVHGHMPAGLSPGPYASGKAPAQAPGGKRPQRIVSLNLCTDQILLQLVDRSRIAGLSKLAADPEMAVLAEHAKGLPLLQGTAEEVLALQPDLVLVGSYTTRHTTQMLQHFGIPVLVVPSADSLQAAQQQLLLVAGSTGDLGRARQIVHDLQQRQHAMQQAHAGQPRLVAAMYDANSYSAGSGTLYDDMLRLAGWTNGAAQAGLQGYGRLPLEQLAALQPRLLLVPDFTHDRAGQSWLAVQHPILKNMQVQQFALPARTVICGGPWNIDAAEALARQRPVAGVRP